MLWTLSVSGNGGQAVSPEPQDEGREDGETAVVREDYRLYSILCARLQLMRACERLGLPRFGHHAMRHFFCSNAIEAGCDFKVIAEWLGHKDGGVLVAKTYGHLRNEHSAAMALRITFDAEAAA